MPESISSEELEVGRAVYGKRNNSEIFKDLVNNHDDLEYIGHGTECLVIGRQGDEKRVVAFRYKEMSPAQMETTFYTERVLSTLFPHNFPHFYSVFYGDKENRIPAGSIRQKIEGSKIANHFSPDYGKLIKYSFFDAGTAIQELEIPVEFDPNTLNYDVGADGGEYFLDTPKLVGHSPFKKELIVDYMAKHPDNYNNYDIQLVEKSVDILNKLIAGEWNPRKKS